MYRFFVNEKVRCCETFEPVDLSFDSSKLFHLDEFYLTNNICSIQYSPIRNQTYIAGVLDITKTYGRENNKLLYLCRPDDKRLPFFLVTYDKRPSFDKSLRYLYVTFQYKHWDKEHPYGTLTQTIGNVEDVNNIYEYMLYCKSLNHPIQPFTKSTISQMKKQPHNELDSLPIRNGHIFTIDSPKSINYDDAISIHNNIISIYISNVPIILDHYDLWDSFSNRISTIYLPDKKRSMLPNVLTERVCSLNEKTNRVCLVMDIEYIDHQIKRSSLSICNARISRNYYFEQDKLLEHKDYKHMKHICQVNNSYDLISKLMIDYNEQCAILLKKHQIGIYKQVSYVSPHSIVDRIKTFQLSSSNYQLFDEHVHYAQTTSPIRRLVDLLNMYLICDKEGLYSFSTKAEDFYHRWISQLDSINLATKHIRKLQSKCKLISIFEKEQHKVFQGMVFDKIPKNEHAYHYNVFLPELDICSSMSCNEDLTEYSEHYFKLFMFKDEALLKKKLKLVLHK